MMSPRSFLDLPEELLELAFSRLSLADLLSLTATTRSLRTFILSTSIRLQYQFYLGCFAVEEQLPAGPGPDLPTARRLELLLERERRWLNLLPARTARLHWPRGLDAHAVRAGIVSSGFESDAGWEDPDREYAVKIATTTVGGAREQLEWVECAATFHLAAVYVSEEEDLLIILEHVPNPASGLLVTQLRFLSLSTGFPHPSAARAAITLEAYPGDMADYTLLERTSAIQRAGTVLAVVVDRPIFEGLKLHVLDWEIGRQVIKPIECQTPVLAFLRPHLLLIANATDCLEVLHIPSLQSEPVAVVAMATLYLPSPNVNSTMMSEFFFCRPTASLDRSADSPSRANAELRFLPRHSDSLLFLTYRVDVSRTNTVHEQTLIVRVAKLLAVLASTTVRHLRAKDWLPHCARWLDPAPTLLLEPPCRSDWHLPHLADTGQRVAGFLNPANFRGPVPLVVIDANPWMVELVQRAARASTGMAGVPNLDHQFESDPPVWRRLGILPGVAADGTLRTESGAVLRLVRASDPVVTLHAFKDFIDRPTRSALAYVEITAPRPAAAAGYDCRVVRMNSESIVLGGSVNDPDSAVVLYFG